MFIMCIHIKTKTKETICHMFDTKAKSNICCHVSFIEYSHIELKVETNTIFITSLHK